MSGNKFTPGTIVMYDPAREGMKGRTIRAKVLESVPYSIKITPVGKSAGWAANEGWYPEFWVAPKSLIVPWNLPWNRPEEPRIKISREEVERVNRNCKPEDLPKYENIFSTRVLIFVWVVALVVLYSIITLIF